MHDFGCKIQRPIKSVAIWRDYVLHINRSNIEDKF
jgi:hypothetical protein